MVDLTDQPNSRGASDTVAAYAELPIGQSPAGIQSTPQSFY
jgi:hypothetical protein